MTSLQTNGGSCSDVPAPKIVMPATLYIVATPIGNRADITRRAVTVLTQVDCICCEDTRHSARLLSELGVHTPTVAVHEHNERPQCAALVARLAQGQTLALISDAGTPLISDPGYVLVNRVAAAGFKVVPIPGPSAVMAALAVSGLPTDRWSFHGFLPPKAAARQRALQALATRQETVVLFESTHRIVASLTDMATVMGASRQAVVCRELTKTFETILRGDLHSLASDVAQSVNQQKGEFVVLIAAAERPPDTSEQEVRLALANELRPLVPPKKAAAIMTRVLGGRKKDHYQLLLSLAPEQQPE